MFSCLFDCIKIKQFSQFSAVAFNDVAAERMLSVFMPWFFVAWLVFPRGIHCGSDDEQLSNNGNVQCQWSSFF